AAQQTADDRHVEVDACGDVRWRQTVAEQQVGQQQVVDMAAMAGHVDDFVALGDIAHTFDVMHLDAVVDLVPEPAQHQFEEADHRVGVVRGNLVAIAQRLGFGLLQADLLALGFLGNRLAHHRVMHQALDQVAPVPDVRADHRGLLVAEVHAQDAVHHAQGALAALVLLDQLAQMDRCGELHAGLASENQDADQPAQAPGDCPAVGEQQFPGAGLVVRRLAPEHAYRHDLRVVHGLLAEGGDYAIQGRRDAALVVAAEPVRLRRQVEEGGGLDMLPDSHRQYRARQAGLGDRKSTRLNSSHVKISYAVFCLKKKTYYKRTN